MMNQVKAQKVKIGRSQIIAKVEVSQNMTMLDDFLCLPLCALLKYTRG